MGRPRKYKDDAEKQQAYRERRSTALRNTTALRNNKELVKVERPVVRYYGGKWRLGEWIINQFPQHITYVEPFAGGASVLMQKPPSTHEVLNDLNGDVINFFRVLRADTEKLVRAIWLTPYSREELRLARTLPATDDPIERARRFYVRCWQSFGSGAGGRDGEDLIEEDPLWYDLSDWEDCDVCDGNGGWWICTNRQNHRSQQPRF